MKTIRQAIEHAIHYLSGYGIEARLAVIYNGGHKQVALILNCTPKEAEL